MIWVLMLLRGFLHIPKKAYFRNDGVFGLNPSTMPYNARNIYPSAPAVSTVMPSTA